MKRKLCCIITFMLILCMAMTALVGCGDANEPFKITSTTETQVVIEVKEATEGQKLIDVLKDLQSKKKLTFVTEDSGWGPFITSINNKVKDDTHSWMIYCDDAENTNTEWGQITVDGKKYASATLGISALPVKAGCHYIFSYIKF